MYCGTTSDPPQNIPHAHCDQSPCLSVKVDGIAAELPCSSLLRLGESVVSTLPVLGDLSLNLQDVLGQTLISYALDNGDEKVVAQLRLQKHIL